MINMTEYKIQSNLHARIDRLKDLNLCMGCMKGRLEEIYFLEMLIL